MAYLGSTGGYVYGFEPQSTDVCDTIWRALATDPTRAAVADGRLCVRRPGRRDRRRSPGLSFHGHGLCADLDR